ncbi:MAG: transporter substrate-binding domain-containing protein [Pseudomonadota bacterium]
MTRRSERQATQPNHTKSGRSMRRLLVSLALVLLMTPHTIQASIAQGFDPRGARAGGIDRIDGPQVERRRILRFVTEAAFPPFNFYDEDGILTGFNVDLARAICLELNATCDIQVQPWESLLPAVQRKDADAVIAAHAVTPDTVAKVAFTDPYFRTPGRFATRRDASTFAATPEGLEGRRVGIVKGSAHEAFVRRFFLGSRIEGFDDIDTARAALKEKRIDALFADGISLAFWLNGTLSQQCCTFRGGPYLEPRFFGDGIAIGVARDNRKLRAELNAALLDVRASGRFQELVARYFPFQIY